MGSCDTCGYFLFALVVIPVILQGYGLFGTEWVTATSCKALNDKPACCNMSTCQTPLGLGDLHQGVYAMQWIAFVILFIPIVCFLSYMCCSGNGDDDYKAILGGMCLLLNPIAGLLSFIGCMIFVDAYSGQSFGKSFNLCLASGLYVLILTAILVCIQCLQK